MFFFSVFFSFYDNALNNQPEIMYQQYKNYNENKYTNLYSKN